MTPVNQRPLATRVFDTNFTVIDWAPGTREDCRIYYVGGASQDVESAPISTSCSDVATRCRVTVNELLFWNPSLIEGPECALSEYAQYCVGIVDIIDNNMTKACVRTATPRAGDDCRNFHLSYRLWASQFTAWNPVVGKDCDNFMPGRVSDPSLPSEG